MRKSLHGALAPILVLAGLCSSWAAPRPVPGPGAVLAAIQKLTAAIDAGDRAGLEAVLAAACPGTSFAPDKAEGMQAVATAVQLCFAEVDAEGKPVLANDRKAAVAAVVDRVAGKPRSMRTTIRGIRSDCPAAECSWGVVDFDRDWQQGGQTMRQSMRATVLVRYEQERGGMAVFAWQAAAVGTPVAVAK